MRRKNKTRQISWNEGYSQSHLFNFSQLDLKHTLAVRANLNCNFCFRFVETNTLTYTIHIHSDFV